MTTHDINVMDTLRQISDNQPPPLPPLSELDKSLFQAVAADDVENITKLLSEGANPNALQPSTRTSVLMTACDIGNLHAVQSLLATRTTKGKSKVPPVLLRERDVRGRNALMVAAEAGHLGIVKLLIDAFDQGDDEPVPSEEAGEQPADQEPVELVDEQDYQGRTALMLATRAPAASVVPVVDYLLSNEGGNAAINITDADDRTALMFAAERGIDDLVSLFLSHPGIDVKHQATGGFTAAVMAAVNGHTDLARKLMVMQKQQEAEAEESKRSANLGMAKGKPKKAKKVKEEQAVEGGAGEVVKVSEVSAGASGSSSRPQRTFKVITQSFGAVDAGNAVERKANKIKAAIKEAKGVAELVGKDLGWGPAEVIAIEELGQKPDAIENLEVAVTFAF